MPALVSALKSVDLPTLGNPTMPHLRLMEFLSLPQIDGLPQKARFYPDRRGFVVQVGPTAEKGNIRALQSLKIDVFPSQPVPALAAYFFQQAHFEDRHAAIDRFQHVVNGE